MKIKLEFLVGGGGGCKTKNILWEEYGYFLELQNKPTMGEYECFLAEHISVQLASIYSDP